MGSAETGAGAPALLGAGAPGAVEAALSRAALVLALYAAFRWTLEVMRLPLHVPVWVLAAAFALTTLGAIGLPIAGIAALARANRSVGMALGAAAAGGIVWLGLVGGMRWIPPPLHVPAAVLQDLGKILAAGGAGVALAAGVREPNILLPAGMFAAFADLVVVRIGTVRHALAPENAKGQALVQAVSAKVPAVHAALPVLTIGPADFLFLGIFLGCAARFGMPLRKTAAVLALVLAGSLMLVPLLGPVPALAPMSIAFVVTNWRRFKLTRHELISTALVLALMGGLFLGYFLLVYRR